MLGLSELCWFRKRRRNKRRSNRMIKIMQGIVKIVIIMATE